jgi:hypothetical protein
MNYLIAAASLGLGWAYQLFFLSKCGFTELKFKKLLFLGSGEDQRESILVAETMHIALADAHYASASNLDDGVAQYDVYEGGDEVGEVATVAATVAP